MFPHSSAYFKRLQWLLVAFTLFFSIDKVCAAQDSTLITLQATNSKIEDVFLKIERQTGLTFYYSAPILDGNQIISIVLNRSTLQNAMRKILDGKNVSWILKDKAIILRKKERGDEALLIDTIPKITLSGTVVDPKGNPIPGATVSVRGQNRGVGTNSYGEFGLANIPFNAVLMISFIGYETKQFRIAGQTDIRVRLDTLIREIKTVEIVSTGYQDIPKERATGSFAQVNTELINRSVSTNILDRLNGVVSGLNFEPSAKTVSQPNKSNIMIRGISTITANSNPLIIVDGFPYDESVTSSTIINNINPNDVLSITVLRDAAAASIWGARSGNGVIVITTKKGRYNQRTNVQFNSNVSVGGLPDLNYIKTLSASDAIDFEKRMFKTGRYNIYDDSYPSIGNFPILPSAIEILLSERKGAISNSDAQAQLAKLEGQNIKDDIRKYLTQRSINQQYSLSFSGGTNNYNYYGSFGYDNNRSNARNDKNNRLTVRYDNTFKPFRKLEINSYLNYIQSSNFNNGFNPATYLPTGNLISPYTKLVDQDGKSLNIPYGVLRTAYVDTAVYPGLLNWKFNPLNELGLNDNVSKQIENRIGVGVKYSIYSALNIEVKYQYQKSVLDTRSYYSPATYIVRNLVNRYMQLSPTGSLSYPIPNAGILDNSELEIINRNLRGQLSFNETFINHSIVAIVGAEVREVNTQSAGYRNYGFDPDNGTIVTNIDYNTRFSTRPGNSLSQISNMNSFNSSINRYVSYFGNIAHTYKGKYSFSASGRIDGSNFFGIKANQRLIPLWSVGGLWDIGKEGFYNIDWLPNLKFRITYGYNGNMYNSVTAYPTLSYASSAALTGAPYATVSTPGNPELKWEKVGMTNLALEFGTRNNRISGNFEFYQKHGVDLIGTKLIDPTTGFTNFIGNRASIRGNGIDLMINTINTQGKVLWQSSFLLSYNTDKVTDYSNTSKTAAGYILGQPFVGKPLYSIFSYKWAGLDPSNGDPRSYVSDTIASYNIVNISSKPEDIVFHGSAIPKFFGSFRNTISYLGFSISCNIMYKFNYYFRKSSIDYIDLLNGWGGSSDYASRWQKTGDENTTFIPSIPATVSSIRESIYRNSSVLVQKGDHIRFQDIRCSYDFIKSKVRGFPIQNATVYLYASNLGIIWRANKYDIDPDYGDTVIPPSRRISVGVSVGF